MLRRQTAQLLGVRASSSTTADSLPYAAFMLGGDADLHHERLYGSVATVAQDLDGEHCVHHPLHADPQRLGAGFAVALASQKAASYLLQMTVSAHTDSSPLSVGAQREGRDRGDTASVAHVRPARCSLTSARVFFPCKARHQNPVLEPPAVRFSKIPLTPPTLLVVVGDRASRAGWEIRRLPPLHEQDGTQPLLLPARPPED